MLHRGYRAGDVLWSSDSICFLEGEFLKNCRQMVLGINNCDSVSLKRDLWVADVSFEFASERTDREEVL